MLHQCLPLDKKRHSLGTRSRIKQQPKVFHVELLNSCQCFRVLGTGAQHWSKCQHGFPACWWHRTCDCCWFRCHQQSSSARPHSGGALSPLWFFSCDLVDSLDDHLEDEGNLLTAAGLCPQHIWFCLCQLSHMALDGSWDCHKLPNCVEAFIKAKFPNVESNKVCIGHYEAEEQEAM